MLDIRTLYILFAATQACLGIIMVIFWRLQKTYPGFRFWTGSRMAAAGAFTLLALRGIIPDNLSILPGNLLAVIFMALALEGIRFFTGARSVWKPSFAIIPLVGIIFLYFTFVQNNELARTLIVDAFFIGYLLAPGWIMLMHSLRTNNRLHRVTGFLFVSYAMALLVCCLVLVMVPPYRGLIDNAGINSAGILIALVAEVSLTFFYIMLQSSRLEDELRQSQRENEEALNITNMAYWEYDPLAETFTFTDRYYKMHGINAQEAGGYQMAAGEYAARFIQPAFITQTRDALQQAVKSNHGDPQKPTEVCLLRASGEPFWGSTWIYPEKDAQGRTTRLHGVTQDITERRKTEDVLHTTQKFTDLGTLAAGVAQELSSPLQVVAGSADSLLKTLEQNGQIETQKLDRYLRNISRNSWRMAAIVHSLNTYAHPTANHSDIYTLNDLVQDTLLFMEHPLNNWSSVQVELRLADNIPPFYCNRNDITQVLTNLLTNSRDSMPNGGRITITSAYRGADDEVILEVNDNGSGIPPEIRPRIFDPFFTTKEMGKGTGMGLSIVHNIMRNYGGRVEVESEVGKGTTFRLFFPCRNGRRPGGE